MKYVEKSVKYFLNQLAAKTPAPGGGSVAALAGALGCGLLSMVANYTMARKGFNGYKERAKKTLKESEKIRKKFLLLVDKDIQEYERLSRALKKSKTHSINLEPAFKRAATAPIQTCLHVHKAAIVCQDLSYIGNKSIISDVCVAMYILDAAFESAMVNVRLNLKYIKDKNYVISKTEACSSFHKDIKRLKAEVLSKTRQDIFG